MRTRPTAARSFSLAIACLVTIGILAPAAAGSARTSPRIVVAHRAKAVAVPVGSWGRIGSLTLPQGRWVLVGTLTLENTTGFSAEGVCQLKLGTSAFVVDASPDVAHRPLPIALMTVGRSTGGSRAIVRCAGYGSEVLRAADVEILAIQAGRVTSVDLNDGSTSGAGRLADGVRVVSGHLDGARMAGNPGYATVAQLPIPAGEWVHLVTANVWSQSASTGSVECRLQAEGDFDAGRVRLQAQGFLGSSQTLALAVAHSFTSAAVAELDCWSEIGSSDAAIGDIQVVALRAGRLTNRAGGGEWTLGTPENGPRMIVGWDDGPDPLATTTTTIGSLDVPSGAWAGFAKSWAQRSAGSAAEASCLARFAGSPGGRSTAELAGTGSSLTDHTLAAAVAGTSVAPTQLVVRCAGGPGNADVSSRFLKMVAIRGASVTRRAA